MPLVTPHLPACRWVHALEEEMFRQGDLEKIKGYPVSPLMDRAKTGITKSQPGVSVRCAWGGMVESLDVWGGRRSREVLRKGASTRNPWRARGA